MSVSGKNHHPSGVDEVRVSESTRQMAREPKLKFADLQQEFNFWKEELASCISQITKIKAYATGNPKHSHELKVAVAHKQDVEKRYLDIKLRVRQERERDLPAEIQKEQFFPVMLKQLMEINASLKTLVELSQKGSP